MANGEVSVSRPALLSQAKTWDSDSATMGGISRTAQGDCFTGNPGGFSAAVDPYNSLCSLTSTQCGEGQTAMQKIADALVVAYKNYNSTEQQLAQSSQQATH